MNRVVITGAGTNNALGATVPETLQPMREGRLGMCPLHKRDLDRLSVKNGAHTKAFDHAIYLDRQQLEMYDHVTQQTLTGRRDVKGRYAM